MHTQFWIENLTEQDHLGDKDKDGTAISKWILPLSDPSRQE